MYVQVFNLMAILYRKILDIIPEKRNSNFSSIIQNKLESEANNLTEKFYSYSYENRQSFYIPNDIINWCSDNQSYLAYLTMLCALDKKINNEHLVSNLEFSKTTFEESQIFEALNINADETGVIILPKVYPYDLRYETEDGSAGRKIKTAEYFSDKVNFKLQNVICVDKSVLQGYKINNAVVNIFDSEPDSITIGFSPGCNLTSDELMHCSTITEKSGEQFYLIDKYYKPEYLRDLNLKSLETAKINDVDIFVGAEMLGSKVLSECDMYGINNYFKITDSEKPKLIITPTFWENGNNYASVFMNNGKLIGRQSKQHPHELHIGSEKFYENLANKSREILLIHVPFVGRIALPICADFLDEDYLTLLMKHLKANLLLCQSYSKGEVCFANMIEIGRKYGSKCLFLNSCSQLQDISSGIGLVSVPVRNRKSLTRPPDCIYPKCNGVCRPGCLFKIKVPLNHSGGKSASVGVSHLC